MHFFQVVKKLTNVPAAVRYTYADIQSLHIQGSRHCSSTAQF